MYTGHTLDCTLHSGMCPWTVHQVYTGLYTRCAFELCTRCVQLCSRCAFGLCARYVQLCSSCSPDVSSCVPAVCQMCPAVFQLWLAVFQMCIGAVCQLCPDVASCVPAVFQLCTRCALDVRWTVHYCPLDGTPLYTVHWVVHTVCALDIPWTYTGLCTTIHWTVKKLKQVPA